MGDDGITYRGRSLLPGPGQPMARIPTGAYATASPQAHGDGVDRAVPSCGIAELHRHEGGECMGLRVDPTRGRARPPRPHARAWRLGADASTGRAAPARRRARRARRRPSSDSSVGSLPQISDLK